MVIYTPKGTAITLTRTSDGAYAGIYPLSWTQGGTTYGKNVIIKVEAKSEAFNKTHRRVMVKCSAQFASMKDQAAMKSQTGTQVGGLYSYHCVLTMPNNAVRQFLELGGNDPYLDGEGNINADVALGFQLQALVTAVVRTVETDTSPNSLPAYGTSTVDSWLAGPVGRGLTGLEPLVETETFGSAS